MPTKTLLVTGTPIVLADITDYAPATANILGTRTDQIDLTSLAAAAARQSDKFDFGATRAGRYKAMAALELATAPTAGEVFEFWIAFSPQSGAANANPGGVSGSDSAYAGYSSNLDESKEQLTFIGTFVLTVQATGTVQKSEIGTFVPTERYGTLVVINQTAGDALHSDAVEMSVMLSPIEDEVQN